ncbi:hypothetical protein ES319_A11G105400v1 [Gossypium barbadense]|uniref:MalT-like TPR region domain-containing protein n=1 Tax=Gossypium barbadense TaxID=3634 RepID=A0A5J5TP54_GOSBA|nr:hypothetical protein ES319_A11G105400v1 [Gossypium barbadense]
MPGQVSVKPPPNAGFDYAIRATKSFERCSGQGLELAMSLHVLAAIYSSLGRFEEAVPVLERSSEVPLLGNESDHALAKFSGCMQLGDTYSMMGQLDRSINSYESGLRIQIEALGDSDSRTCSETVRYLAEAHVVKALEIHKEHSAPGPLEEAADHQLMALVCEAKGDYGSALQHLVRASMSMIANDLMRQSLPIRRHLTVFKSTKGESHPSLASVFIRLADLYNKTGKLRESKFYSENAFRIYSKQVPGTTPEEIAGGLTEPVEALKLLEMAMKLLEDTHGNISIIARIEAQMGGMFYLVGRYGEQMCNVQLYRIDEAVGMILLVLLKPFTNCSFARHSKKGFLEFVIAEVIYAIEILKYILKIREEKSGMENPNVDDEKIRLAAIRNRKRKSLENLLNANSYRTKMKSTNKWSIFYIRS